jgi:hypothetical protein
MPIEVQVALADALRRSKATLIKSTGDKLRALIR